MKVAVYRNFSKTLNRSIVSKLVIFDELKKDEITVMEYSDWKLKELPNVMFTKDYLKEIPF